MKAKGLWAGFEDSALDDSAVEQEPLLVVEGVMRADEELTVWVRVAKLEQLGFYCCLQELPA